MAKLIWDDTGERLYETGVKQGVLYPLNTSGAYTPGVAWNGLISVSESPEGAEPEPLYANDTKYINLMSKEEFKCSINAYTYPDEFAQCDGSISIATGVMIGQQKRKTFGFCYKTTLGNDTENDSYGYKLHLVYGCLAAPSEKEYSTINDSPEAIEFTWDVSTTPVNVTGYEPTSIITIDSTKFTTDALKGQLTSLEKILYGDVYTALTAQPDDWADNYSKYYIATTTSGTTTYIPVTGTDGAAPTWEADKYFASADARLPLPDEVASIITTTAQG